ncbi:Predicted dienelactone hydrolase [Legionella beliardensis]|uniref:Predicted dienelactone hydrolase n=1 Tax=Legionella beliardensis TaxID=91822 RepID=A0A378HZW4_9GAMM|nr:hypothetical protein [Legionella beliardensis]STX28488.1 Predicted dienelactone hydrolase [Legionella beliardensis]
MRCKGYLKLALSIYLLPKLVWAIALPPALEGPYRVGHTSIILQDFSRAPNVIIPDSIYQSYGLQEAFVRSLYENRGRRFIVDIWYPSQSTVTSPLAEYTFNHTVESDMPPYVPFPTTIANCRNDYELLGPLAKTALNAPFNNIPPSAPNANPPPPPYSQVVCPGEATINFYSKIATENLPVAPGNFPVIVYSHGNGGQAIEFYKVAERLANNGFIVAALNHGNGYTNYYYNLLAPNIQSLDYVYSNLDFTIPPDNIADINFLVENLITKNSQDTNTPSFQNHININQFGAAGFSLGACNALILAGGSNTLGIAANPRFKAIMPYETCASDDYIEAPVSSNENIRSITLPVFTIYGDSSYARNRVFNLLPSQQAPKYEVILKNSAHQLDSSFCAIYEAQFKFLAANPNPQAFLPNENLFFGGVSTNSGLSNLLNTCPKTTIPANYYSLTNIVIDSSNYWSATLPSFNTQLEYLYGYNPLPWVFDIPPGNFPRYLDEDKLSHFLAFYGTAFFKRYLTNDTNYDNYLKPGFTQKFMPEQRMTKCFKGVCEKTNRLG